MDSLRDIRNQILHILKSISSPINEEDITDDVNLTDAGLLDSLGFLIFATRVQQEFNIVIPFDRYAPEEFTTFGKFVSICGSTLANKTNEHRSSND